MAQNMCPVSYQIMATRILWDEDAGWYKPHMVWMASFNMFGLPFGMTWDESLELFYNELMKQVRFVYLTKEVPKDITWTGYVFVGLNMN
jgi:hypothetical protein